MKTIKIRKSTQFSEDSRVMIHAGEKAMYIRGFDARPFTVEESEELYASHQWTQSNRMAYNRLEDGSTYIILPRLNKRLAFIIFVVLMVCTVICIFTRNRWSFVPLIPIGIYILTYLTILRKKYLILEPYD